MYDSNKGISRLAGVMQEQMKKVNDTTPLALDFGSIGGDFSLKCNNFSKPIPRSDYLVGRQPTLGPIGILPGDRVLVAWIQNEAVVIDVVKKM